MLEVVRAKVRRGSLELVVPALLQRRSRQRQQLKPQLSPERSRAREELIDVLAHSSVLREEQRACYLCGQAGRFLVLAGADRWGIPMRTLLCRDCGLSCASPMLSEHALSEFYAGPYWRLEAERPLCFDAATLERGRSILQFVREHHPAASSLRQVLEIGAGAGWNLAAFTEAGITAIGLEPDHELVHEGRAKLQVDLRVGTEKTAFEHGVRPDVLVLSHVLEHSPRPIAFLESLLPLLSEDAVLYVEVPGLRNLDNPWYVGDLLNYLQIAHCYNFTRVTVCAVLARAGFEIVASNDVVQVIARRAHARVTDHPKRDGSDAEQTLRYLLACELRRPRGTRYGRALQRGMLAVGAGRNRS